MNNFYSNLSTLRNDSVELQKCVSDVIDNLSSNTTTVNRPGMLLGKIQSGKTRAFIGVIAKAFDVEYDISIVLTKGTKALSRQTFERITADFEESINDDQIQVFDIMNFPKNLPKYVLQQKLIIVAKKQKDNLEKVIRALEETYPDLIDKKILIIDDEADFASIGFSKDKEVDFKIKKIAGLIDSLRTKVKKSDYLQVTATPYSLYLQPEDIEISGDIFKPIRPAFTVLLPTYDGYIGGEYYFNEEDYESTVDDYIYQEIHSDELQVIKNEDRRVFKIEDALVSKKIRSLRTAITNFIVGASIRRIQQKEAGGKMSKYSFIVHTQITKMTHTWQECIVQAIVDQISDLVRQDPGLFIEILKKSYDNLHNSLSILSIDIPTFEVVKDEVFCSLNNGYIMITKVNSEKQVEELLDQKGQLKLTTPLNIFIGGQILDRGITIDNLIGFYYGRRPNKFQQDTVLQHSRMYGNRSINDLGVTRFYTTADIYQAMKKIHEFDKSLRDAFANGGHNEGVVFIRKDVGDRIIPCSPNKILLSTLTSLKPYKRMLPYGFDTKYKTQMLDDLDDLDKIILNSVDSENMGTISIGLAKAIIDKINKTFVFDDGYEWDVDAFKAGMEYLSSNTGIPQENGKVILVVRTNRNISRKDERDMFENAPDTPKGERGETRVARELAENIPALILLRQNGNVENGWRGSPFWWPVLIAPKNSHTVIYASDTISSS